jgi:peptidoglycan/LPS O-acetylase OafA/YrhL
VTKSAPFKFGLPHPTDHRGHLPGLDALRAFAVLGVILFHRQLFASGWMGVQVFFVLSGYLITRSLYTSRDQRLWEYLKTFYGRRSLRIFPLYYATLALISVGLFFGASYSEGVKAGLPYALTYTFNFFHASPGFQHSKMLGHFWTLAVEEQFYLIWPFLIYFCPRKRLGLALFIVAILGPLLRAVAYFYGTQLGLPIEERNAAAATVLTTSHIDAFAIGAWAALFPPSLNTKQLIFVFMTVVIAGVGMLIFYDLPWHSFGYHAPLEPAYGFIWQVSLLNIAGAVLIDALVRERVFPSLFRVAWLRYLGTISYGAYVFHFPVQALVDRGLRSQPELVRLGAELLITFGAASLSYRFFELKFLELKKHFPVSESPVVPRAS